MAIRIVSNTPQLPHRYCSSISLSTPRSRVGCATPRTRHRTATNFVAGSSSVGCPPRRRPRRWLGGRASYPQNSSSWTVSRSLPTLGRKPSPQSMVPSRPRWMRQRGKKSRGRRGRRRRGRQPRRSRRWCWCPPRLPPCPHGEVLHPQSLRPQRVCRRSSRSSPPERWQSNRIRLRAGPQESFASPRAGLHRRADRVAAVDGRISCETDPRRVDRLPRGTCSHRTSRVLD